MKDDAQLVVSIFASLPKGKDACDWQTPLMLEFHEVSEATGQALCHIDYLVPTPPIACHIWQMQVRHE